MVTSQPNDVVERSEFLEFGRFKFEPTRRQLLMEGHAIDLGDRAIDLLAILVQAGGAVVSKDHLLKTVWAGRVVEENALQAQISILRKALGSERDLIKTVAGRGYQFTGEPRAAHSFPVPLRVQTNLPEALSELIGRDVQIADLVNLLAQNRLVTLIGTGGIGKTQLALKVARQVLSKYRDGVWVAQLAPLSDPKLVAWTVSNALGLPQVGETLSDDQVSRAVGTRQALIVLDSCEHVIDAATEIADRLLKCGRHLRVLATSREPLRADGEYVYRVPPLEFPPESAFEVGNPMRWGALNLFVSRARESAPEFSIDVESVAKVIQICRRLDGIPLAVELAARRTAALGVHELAARLDDHLGLLSQGKSTALPHQQTLQATLEWSHQLLTASERVILRRLSIFAGEFSLDAARTVVSDGEFAALDVIDIVSNLVVKSLVTAGVPGPNQGYRLLETTRSYALVRLGASGELEVLSRRHADYYNSLFQRADVDWSNLPSQAWLENYKPCIDNLRAALNWAFSSNGDVAVGVELTVAAIPLWFQLSQIDECLSSVERALSTIAEGASAENCQQMKLQAARGWSLMYTTGRARETGEAWSRALNFAERLNDTDYRLRALWGLWAGHVNNGHFQRALGLAEDFCAVARDSPEPADIFVGERLVAAASHFLGDQVGAREQIEHMLQHYVAPIRRSHIVRFQFDQRLTARITLARVLWLQGFPDRAMQEVESTVADALSLDHELSVGNVLAQAACPVSLLAGNLVAADRFITMFMNHTRRSALDIWHSYARCFSGMLSIRRGELAEGLRLLQAGLSELRGARFTQYKSAFLIALADGLGAAGRAREASNAVAEGLRQSEASQERWCLPELLRVRGELESIQGQPSSIVETTLGMSLEWARRQGALSWELRTATSLARKRVAEGRTVEAREILAPVRQRFSEGFDSSDLKDASVLLTKVGGVASEVLPG
jgi:predicted ATPase/DNA-binding winged helix-turn-helix (wHTH) protein